MKKKKVTVVLSLGAAALLLIGGISVYAHQTSDSGESETVYKETTAEYGIDRKSTRLNSSHLRISYAVFCLKKFFFNDTATTEIYTLSLHDALPIYCKIVCNKVINRCCKIMVY